MKKTYFFKSRIFSDQLPYLFILFLSQFPIIKEKNSYDWRFDMKRIRSELHKIRQLPPGKRLCYLWDYYKIHFFFLLFFLVFFFYFLFPLFTAPKKNTILSLAIIDSSESAKTDTSALSGIALAALDADLEKDQIQIDTSGTTYDTSSSSTIKVAILLSSVGENDIVICGKELYEQYNAQGAFLDPASYDETLSSSASDAVTGNAFDLSQCQNWISLGCTDYTPVYACIPVSSKHPERAITFLNFLYTD